MTTDPHPVSGAYRTETGWVIPLDEPELCPDDDETGPHCDPRPDDGEAW